MGTLGMLSAIMLLSSKIGVVSKLSNSYSEKNWVRMYESGSDGEERVYAARAATVDVLCASMTAAMASLTFAR